MIPEGVEHALEFFHDVIALTYLIAEGFELVTDLDVIIGGLFLYNFKLMHDVITHMPQVDFL
jgi:hypothetical protein